jgi:hypothetical protein
LTNLVRIDVIEGRGTYFMSTRRNSKFSLVLVSMASLVLSGCFQGELDLLASEELGSGSNGGSIGGSSGGSGMNFYAPYVCVPMNSFVDMTTTGGVPPYTYSIDSGPGSINASGRYTSTSSMGTAILRATDSTSAFITSHVIVSSPLYFNPSFAVIDPGENKLFSNSGGCGPITSTTLIAGEGSLSGVSVAGFTYVAPLSPNPAAAAPRIRVDDSYGGFFESSLDLRRWHSSQVLSPGGFDASANALTFDTSGSSTLYAAGYYVLNPGDAKTWVVNRKDNGASWVTSDQFQLATNRNSIAYGVAGSNNEMYAVGEAVNVSTVSSWLVRKFNGATWAIVDNFLPTYGAGARAIAISASGTYITVSGYQNVSAGLPQWTTRRSVDAGVTWNAIDSNFNLAAGQSSSAAAMGFDNIGNLWVTGFAADAGGALKWVARKWDGFTWVTVLNHAPFTGFAAKGTGVAVNFSNQVFLSGYYTDNSSVTHWSVRSTTDGGTTWVDEALPSIGGNTVATGISTDVNGNVYATGTAYSPPRWIVMKKNASTGNWGIIANYQMSISDPSIPFASVSDFSGSSLWVAGRPQTPSNSFWGVQALRATPP